MRNHKTVVAVAQHLQPHLGGFRERGFVEQYAVGSHRATTNAPAQLVELGKAETLRVFDDHQAGIGDVHADFDHRGGDQQMQITLFERLHHRLFFGGLHASVNQTDVQLRQRQLKLFPRGFGSLRFQQFRLFNQRTDPVGLTSFVGAGVAHAVDDIAAARVRNGDRCDRGTARRQFVDGGGIQIGIGGHRQGARNRCSGHDQLMRVEALLQTFFP